MKKASAKQMEEIRGAMGGWVCRSQHSVVEVSRRDIKGRYWATVTFEVDPRRDERRITAEEMTARKVVRGKAGGKAIAKLRAIKASYRKQKRGGA